MSEKKWFAIGVVAGILLVIYVGVLVKTVTTPIKTVATPVEKIKSVFLTDGSGSMLTCGPTTKPYTLQDNIKFLKQAVINYIEPHTGDAHKKYAVLFGDDTYVLAGPAIDHKNALLRIERVMHDSEEIWKETGYSSELGKGLREAILLFSSNTNIEKRIVLVSDGAVEVDNALKAVIRELNKKNIQVTWLLTYCANGLPDPGQELVKLAKKNNWKVIETKFSELPLVAKEL